MKIVFGKPLVKSRKQIKWSVGAFWLDGRIDMTLYYTNPSSKFEYRNICLNEKEISGVRLLVWNTSTLKDVSLFDFANATTAVVKYSMKHNVPVLTDDGEYTGTPP